MSKRSPAPAFTSFVLTLALGAAACGSDNSGKQTAEPQPSASAGPDEAAEDAEATPDEAKPSREELVANALARVPDIQNGVAELRGLKFETAVPAEYQEEADFRAFVKQEIARELPPEKNAKLGKALHHIGLLKQEMDLAQVLEDAMVTQAGAYYDPKQNKFFLVMVPTSDLILDTISSHELTHALQDQHFNLDKYYYGHEGDGPPLFNEDQLNARRFIVEGEATFLMVVYGGYAMAKLNMLEDKYIEQLRPQLEMFGKMDIDQLTALNKSQAESSFVDMGEDFKKSLDALDTIPLYVLVPLLDSYMKGVMPVYETYVNGGWDAVATLYTNPPDSTEQVLHPADKLVGKRDYPVGISLKAPKGWSELYGEVMGELGWRVYFMVWEADDPTAAAAGWDGDRYMVYENDCALVALIATTWDSPEDAKQFTDAYLASLTKRFPESAAPAKGKGGVVSVPRPDGTSVYVMTKGKDVFIADGAPDDSFVKLAARAKKSKDKRDR
jgi:hypothetical protein